MINLHKLAHNGTQAAWLQFSPLLSDALPGSVWWVLVVAILLVILLLAWAWRSYNHDSPDTWKPYSITPAPPAAPDSSASTTHPQDKPGIQ